MTAPATRPMDSPRFALADRIAQRVMDRAPVDLATREAVDVLTADADPERAERLAVRPGEPGPLVERLAVWALHRASDEAVARADRVLDAEERPSVPDVGTSAARAADAATVGDALETAYC